MQSKRKILFLMPSLVGGGAERTLINLLHKVDYNKFEIDLVLLSNHGTYLNQVPEYVKVTSLFHNKFFVRVLSYLRKKYGFIWLFRRKIQQKVKGNYKVGISFLDGSITDLLFFVNGIEKRFAWVHASYKTNRNFARFYKDPKYCEKLKNDRYGKLDGIYFVSQDAMDDFIEVFGRYPEMRVIYNLIDSKSVIDKSKLDKSLKKDKFQFIALGSLLPIKGFDRLIKAARMVLDKGFDFRLVIAGTGSEEQELRKLVKENDLEQTVKFVGFLSNPYSILKKSDVFVMSSISEALPTVLCEAMILGKPTLVTNCSGCREIVEHGKYGLMAKQDDEDLAKNMINYLSNPELLDYYHEKSLERAKLFDDKRILNEYYEIFEQ